MKKIKQHFLLAFVLIGVATVSMSCEDVPVDEPEPQLKTNCCAAQRAYLRKIAKQGKEDNRMIVEVEAHPSMDRATASVTFVKDDSPAKPPADPIVLKAVRTIGDKKETIVLESEDFQFSESTTDQSYSFVLEVYNNDKEITETLSYKVSFEATDKETTFYDAIPFYNARFADITVYIPREGGKIPDNGYFDISIAVKKDEEKVVGGIQISVLETDSKTDISPAKITAKFAGTAKGDNMIRVFTSKNDLSFKGAVTGARASLEFVLLDMEGNLYANPDTKLTVKEVKELSDILKDDYGIEPAAPAK